jgi:hypothetical protein
MVAPPVLNDSVHLFLHARSKAGDHVRRGCFCFKNLLVGVKRIIGNVETTSHTYKHPIRESKTLALQGSSVKETVGGIHDSKTRSNWRALVKIN